MLARTKMIFPACTLVALLLFQLAAGSSKFSIISEPVEPSVEPTEASNKPTFAPTSQPISLFPSPKPTKQSSFKSPSPSILPTVAPSTVTPTFIPTSQVAIPVDQNIPTSAPYKVSYLSFVSTLRISNIIFSSGESLSESAKQSINGAAASAMQISPKSIAFTSYTAATSTPTIITANIYTTVNLALFPSSTSATSIYQQLSQALQTSQVLGTLTVYLHLQSVMFGATQTVNGTIIKVVSSDDSVMDYTFAPTAARLAPTHSPLKPAPPSSTSSSSASSSGAQLSVGAVVGVVVAVVLAIAALGVIAYRQGYFKAADKYENVGLIKESRKLSSSSSSDHGDVPQSRPPLFDFHAGASGTGYSSYRSSGSKKRGGGEGRGGGRGGCVEDGIESSSSFLSSATVTAASSSSRSLPRSMDVAGAGTGTGTPHYGEEKNNMKERKGSRGRRTDSRGSDDDSDDESQFGWAPAEGSHWVGTGAGSPPRGVKAASVVGYADRKLHTATATSTVTATSSAARVNGSSGKSLVSGGGEGSGTGLLDDLDDVDMSIYWKENEDCVKGFNDSAAAQASTVSHCENSSSREGSMLADPRTGDLYRAGMRESGDGGGDGSSSDDEGREDDNAAVRVALVATPRSLATATPNPTPTSPTVTSMLKL